MPLFVKLLADVKVLKPVVPSASSLRIDALEVVSGPLTLTEALAIAVPWLSSPPLNAMFVALRVNRPWFTNAPVPAIVLVVLENAPVGFTVIVPLSVSVREDNASVCTPEPPPTMRTAPVNVVSRVTV